MQHSVQALLDGSLAIVGMVSLWDEAGFMLDTTCCCGYACNWPEWICKMSKSTNSGYL
jgi:hypothetical protein